MIGNSYGMETNLKDNSRVRVFSEGVPAAETKEQAALRHATGGENDGNARQAARYIKETGERYVDHLEVKMVYRKDRFLRGGDHTPFSAEGFTAVRITEMNEDFNRQHQDIRTEKGFKFGDLPEYVDYHLPAENYQVKFGCVGQSGSGTGTTSRSCVDYFHTYQ